MTDDNGRKTLVGDPLGERFWSKVRKTEGCWEWIGGRATAGYGGYWWGRKVIQAHRVAYEVLVGPIPDGAVIRHACDNPGCVRPDHLLIGTDADNAADCSRRDRRPARFSNAQAREIVGRYAAGESQRALARALGTSQAEIWYVVNRRARFL